MTEAEWSRFAGGLIGYIHCGTSKLLKVDYKIPHITLTDMQIYDELTKKNKIEDLCPELQGIAKQYLKEIKKSTL